MIIPQKLELKQILNPYLPYLDKVDKYIERFITTDLRILDVSTKQIFKNPGKKIRASFVLLGASAQESDEKLDTAIDLASGVELVHAATLVHDDIIDHADFRRGNQTVSKKFGNKVGVLVGDWMFTRGLDIAANEKNSKILPILIEATREMVKGELAQIEFSAIETIKENHYLDIIAAKTAGFLGACIQVGALHRNAETEFSRELFQFGFHCGMGFQISDDLMDFSDKNTTGKDSANDYLDGKATLPVIYLLAKDSLQKEVFDLYRERNLYKFSRLKEIVFEEKSFDLALAKGKNYIERGLAHLDNISSQMDRNVVEILQKLVNFFIKRNF